MSQITNSKWDPESVLKGRIAETLVEDLLKQSGNTVYRFGYEAIIQNLTQIKQQFSRDCEAGERIRTIPDFIIVDPQGKPIFLEVKYRWDGKPHEDDSTKLRRISDLWKAKILIVNKNSKPYFQVSNPPYIQEGELHCIPLLEDKDIKVNPELYAKFEDLVERYINR